MKLKGLSHEANDSRFVTSNKGWMNNYDQKRKAIHSRMLSQGKQRNDFNPR